MSATKGIRAPASAREPGRGKICSATAGGTPRSPSRTGPRISRSLAETQAQAADARTEAEIAKARAEEEMQKRIELEARLKAMEAILRQPPPSSNGTY